MIRKRLGVFVQFVAVVGVIGGLLASCGPSVPEMTRAQVQAYLARPHNSLFEKTVNRPGGGPYQKGLPGGTWRTFLTQDPKSFSPLHEQDSETAAVVGPLSDSLLEYDVYRRAWRPNIASYKVSVNQAAQTLDITFTLRPDLWWTSLADPQKKVRVTSDDVVFWYNQIEGNPELQQSGYAGQFVQMPDGSQKRITIQKLDDRTFVFHYPRVVAMPELSSNMDFGPRYVFEPVLKKQGAAGVLKLWTIDTDPRTLPSMGPYYLASYHPGLGVTLVRNPWYWKRDRFGQRIPYIHAIEDKILPNLETVKLKFLAGDLDSYTLRPQDLSDLVKEPRDYTVFSAGPSLGAQFFSWNQNPRNKDKPFYSWFTQAKFRQAMSCFFNRQRVIDQVYRGLAEPALWFFAKPNPFFDPSIQQTYLYDPARGLRLLADLGIHPGPDGRLRDAQGHVIAFTLTVTNDSNLPIDIANVYADELKKVGITLTVRPLDFQKIVDSLLKTYDWQMILIGLSGANYFPTQGDNVWLSQGNLHLWNPLQKTPATPWEARLDSLYWQGYATRDHAKAQQIWDQFQRIVLNEVPLLYTVYPEVFRAVRNRWGNVAVDNVGAPDMNYVYLTP